MNQGAILQSVCFSMTSLAWEYSTSY